MTKPLKLTDMQLMLLSSASQRKDRLLAPLEQLKGGAAKAVIAKLLTHALVAEVPVGRDDPHWRVEEEQAIGLKLTRAGLQAIGVEEEQPAGTEELGQGSPEPGAADPGEPPSGSTTEPSAAGAGEPQGMPSPSAPREGTKQALVLSLLARPQGATLDDLLSATGWLPHTTRAALTGLRQRGYQIARTRGEDNRVAYCIVSGTSEETQTGADEAPAPGGAPAADQVA